MYIDARHASFKYLAGHRLIKVMKIITQVMTDDPKIVADARSIKAPAKFA
jgi:hypothetical protein